VLVIGGAGYVGSVLVRQLLDRGYPVSILDALVYGDEGIAELYGRPGFDLVRTDLRDNEAIARAADGAQSVVHIGGLVGDPACAIDESLTLEVNLQSTRTIGEIARDAGVQRFVFASSCAVYGASDGLLEEGSPLAPVSIYARTKMDSERVLLGLATPGFAPVILRFGTFYGLSPRPRFDLVVNLLVAKAVADGEITIYGGSQWRPLVHVADGSEAVLRCLEAPVDLVHREVFNVGSDEQNFTLFQVADTIARHVPGVRVVYAEEAVDEADYRVSFAKVHRQLGFVSSRSLVDGIAELAASISTGEISDYRQIRYSNIKSLTLGQSADVLRHGGQGTKDLPPRAGAEAVRR
jgi:nucleoside-diphosphate-sugar epimerase